MVLNETEKRFGIVNILVFFFFLPLDERVDVVSFLLFGFDSMFVGEELISSKFLFMIQFQ